jgi:hypothetical protein
MDFSIRNVISEKLNVDQVTIYILQLPTEDAFATLFEDDRSLIFILLSLYVMNPDQFGEIQTDAPESMITLELTVLLDRQ